MQKNCCKSEMADRSCLSSLIRIGTSRKIAFCLFAVSTALLAICIWRHGDQVWSYFAQESYWTPPVLVVSSDDWGGVNSPETVEDLDKLRDVLMSVTDAEGKPLTLTAYMNPAEPDFERIYEEQYSSYSYRYCYRNKPEVALRLRELHEEGLVDIQFHGREHYNIPLWLSLLRDDHPGFREACRACRIPWRESPGWDGKAGTDPRLPFLRQSFLNASSYPTKALSVEEQREIIASGLAMMEAELGLRPVIFTAPGYAYDTNTLHAMALAGIWFIDSNKRRIQLTDDEGNVMESGERLDYGAEIGVRGIVRNASFEPYKKKRLAVTMIEIRRALASGRPIVVSSHRWNYVGAVNPNRDRDLLLLRELAAQTKAEAPDVVFLSASDLAKHLYLGGAGARRNVKLKIRSLSGAEKVMHGLRCTWVGHGRIRTATCIAGLSLLWLCVAGALRGRFHAV